MDHGAPSRRPAERTQVRRVLMTAGVVVVFLAGLAVGLVVPGDPAELDAANAAATESRQEVADLELELADLTEANDQLTAALDDAKEAAASAAALDARQRSLDRRELRLDRREVRLDGRRQELATTTAPPRRRSGGAGAAGSSVRHSGDAGFDRAWAHQVARDIRADIRTVDHRLRSGPGVGPALSLLSDSYGRLASAGTPAGVDRADYQARVRTLQALAETAAEEYLVDPAEGRARYAVVRTETGVLLDQLNAALGTHLRLP